MIRERVSTHAIIQPLDEFPVLSLPSGVIRVIGVNLRRSYDAIWLQINKADQEFASVVKDIEKQRVRNINRECKGFTLCTSVLRSSPPRRTAP